MKKAPRGCGEFLYHPAFMCAEINYLSVVGEGLYQFGGFFQMFIVKSRERVVKDKKRPVLREHIIRECKSEAECGKRSLTRA